MTSAQQCTGLSELFQTLSLFTPVINAVVIEDVDTIPTQGPEVARVASARRKNGESAAWGEWDGGGNGAKMCRMLTMELNHGGRGRSPGRRTASLRGRVERSNDRSPKVGKQAAGGGSGGRFLSPRSGCFACSVLAGNEDLAQHMKIAAQHRKLDVPRESWFRPVATAHQPVACLQRADRRFDTRMPPPRGSGTRWSPPVLVVLPDGSRAWADKGGR